MCTVAMAFLIRWHGAPAKHLGDLFGEGERVEGFEEDGRDAEAGKSALIDALDLGGEEKDGDVGDGGILLHVAEGGGAVDLGHHDVHEDGVGLFGGGDFDAVGAGAWR